ncbi:hypothetical protein H6P81_000436 [Aristolochia fimbriata]|uniref:Antifreeze protein n=1 Tax=Aristolochia fimbriata TaxID=158543 RepID=A0AAV7F8M1_ARIFI|nr:hypothetical protein H6P81_000436 [Aristolochia fimbriata]
MRATAEVFATTAGITPAHAIRTFPGVVEALAEDFVTIPSLIARPAKAPPTPAGADPSPEAMLKITRNFDAVSALIVAM